ncbi:MAG: Mevalonate kinase [Francisellaceae bacterium]|nr:Mevalonate kinase [Francisellaceae bacterium]
MQPSVSARAPSKLILSGEHAVIYGNPALAMALDSYAQTTFQELPTKHFKFNFSNLGLTKVYSSQDLINLKTKCFVRYKQFQEEKCDIKNVIAKPFDLLVVGLIQALEQHNFLSQLKHGLEISINSDIPMGAGMGSSAASIISLLFSLHHFLKLNLSRLDLLKLGIELENLQHGRSSGLDVQLALNGGNVRFQAGKLQLRALPRVSYYLINTGQPHSSTGECVSAVVKHFKSLSLLDDFKAVTDFLDKAFQDNELREIQKGIEENHQLLIKIGVVPQKIQDFMKALKKLGVSGKICGAGTIRGETGGLILVIGSADIQNLVDKYGYEILPINGSEQGVHLV